MNTVVETLNAAGREFVDFSLPMLVQSALLILILLAADILLRRRVRAVFRYWVWMLVLVKGPPNAINRVGDPKLVLPPSLGSPVSVGTWFGDSLQIPTARFEPEPPVAQPPSAEVRIPSEAAIALPPPDPWLWVAASSPKGLGMVERTERVAIPKLRLRLGLPNAMNGVWGPLPPPETPGEMEHPVASETGTFAHPPAPALTWQGLGLLIWSVILIPQTLATRFQGHDLHAVLLHELAHVKRHDNH
jgi:hypothetical protein